MLQNEDSQFLTLNELDQLFGDGRACVGLELNGVVTRIRGEVF